MYNQAQFSDATTHRTNSYQRVSRLSTEHILAENYLEFVILCSNSWLKTKVTTRQKGVLPRCCSEVQGSDWLNSCICSEPVQRYRSQNGWEGWVGKGSFLEWKVRSVIWVTWVSRWAEWTERAGEMSKLGVSWVSWVGDLDWVARVMTWGPSHELNDLLGSLSHWENWGIKSVVACERFSATVPRKTPTSNARIIRLSTLVHPPLPLPSQPRYALIFLIRV